MSVLLEFLPSYSSSVSVKPRVKLVRFGDGYVQRGADGINLYPQVWDITFANRSAVECDDIEALLRSAAGGTISWVPPGATLPINFMCLEWKRLYQDFDAHTITCQLEQVFEP